MQVIGEFMSSVDKKKIKVFEIFEVNFTFYPPEAAPCVVVAFEKSFGVYPNIIGCFFLILIF